MLASDEIATEVRAHIVAEFLQGEDPANLTEEVKLVSDGLIDSLSALKLVSFLEERFAIKVDPHEIDVENLDTIGSIVALVQRKSLA